MKPPSNVLVWTTLLIEGFVSLSLQVITIRQLQPFVGNTVIVTSTIIGAFLLFLSIGYYRGGRFEGDSASRLKNNFFKTALLIGLGLSYDWLNIYFNIMDFVPIYVSLTIFLLCYVCAPVYWLSQTLPLMTSAFNKLSTRQASGACLTLNTIGSFLGAIITASVLMNWLGTGWTLWVNSVLLVLLGIILMPKLQTFTLALLIVSTTALANADLGQKLLRTTAYAHYQTETLSRNTVGEYVETNNLYINRALASSIDANGKAGPYIEKIKEMIDVREGPLNILVLGAGSFSLSRGSHHRYTYVDIDPVVKNIAEQQFGIVVDKFISTDARQYVRNSTALFDIVVLDVYSSGVAIPFHLVTQQFFSDLKSRLSEEGVLIMNIIANPQFSDPYSRNIHRTIANVFDFCTRHPLSYDDQAVNIIYHCQKITSNLPIYTDQLNRSSYEHSKLLRKAEKL